jgi:Protein of unknown function (DUF5818)
MHVCTQNRWIVGTLALMLVGAPRFYAQQLNLHAAGTSWSQQEQQTPPPSQSSSNDQAPPSDDGQVFTGTVVKSGETYILRHASGKLYDVDHPEDLKPYEGQQVRVRGTLDRDGKTIHMK